MSYLQRRPSGIYEVRVQLPRGLSGEVAPARVRADPKFSPLLNPQSGRFKREVTRSLKTRDPAEAKRRGLGTAASIRDLIDAARAIIEGREGASGDPLAHQHAGTIRDILEGVAGRILAEDDAEREEGDDRRHVMTPEERAERFPDLAPLRHHSPAAAGMEDDHFAVLAGGGEDSIAVEINADMARVEVSPGRFEQLPGPRHGTVTVVHAPKGLAEQQLSDHRAARARRSTEIIRAEAHGELRRRGIEPASLSETELRKFELGYLDATTIGLEGRHLRNLGEDVPTPSPGGNRGPRLSEAYAAWKGGSGARRSRKPAANTLREADYAVRRFREFAKGDIRIAEITRDMARGFRDAMVKVPKGLPEKLRTLPLHALLTRDLSGYPVRSEGTVNKQLTILAAIISHAETEGHLDKVTGFRNPFVKVKLKADKAAGDAREPFSAADLKALFATAVFTQAERPLAGGGEAAFWFPLIGLLSGMRLEEIAGLRIGDLREDGAAGWFFDVTPDSGRRLKTTGSRRRVPVHPELTRAGLLDYRAAVLKVSGGNLEASLWPALRGDGARSKTGGGDLGRLSQPWSKWFGRHLRVKAGITDTRKVFHSFRHSFMDLCRDAGLHEELYHAFTGHVGGGGVGRGYGSGHSLSVLAAAMARIEAPEAVRALTWQQRDLSASR